MSAKVWTLVLFAGAVVSAEFSSSLTSIEEIPSLAQIEFNLETIWVQQCAGVLITNRHVISTASCFSGPQYSDEYRRIRLGSSYRSREGQVLTVEKILVHEDYGLLGKDGDISIIHLEEYVIFDATIQQAPILGQGIELPFGLQVQLSGWGTTAEGGEESSDDLYTADLYVHTNDNCLTQYYPEYISENMVCVGSGYRSGRDFDVIDLGAPLFYEDTLVGLLSFGKVADDEYPVVATSVGSYSEWIVASAA